MEWRGIASGLVKAGKMLPPLEGLEIHEEKVLKSQHMKLLYCLWLQFSSDISLHRDNIEETFSVDSFNHNYQIRKLNEICHLSDLTFKELETQFELIFGEGFTSPVTASQKKAGWHSDTCSSPEDLILLLRSCMILLPLLEFNLSLVLEKCQILVRILGKLCSSEFLCSSDLVLHFSTSEEVSKEGIIGSKCSGAHECTCKDLASTCFSKEFSSPKPLIRSLLEVFADELLVNQHLKKHFIVTDYICSSGEKLFVRHCCNVDIGAILEVVSAHFLQSVYDERTFCRFVCSLYWSGTMDEEFPKLSLTASLMLFRNPVIFSAPCMFQAHLISLASRCIGIGTSPGGGKPDAMLINNYISAFEQSVSIYTYYLSSLDLGDDLNGARGEGSYCFTEQRTLKNSPHLSFDYYVRPVTRNKVSFQIQNLFGSCQAHLHTARTKVDIASTLRNYIRENQHIIEEWCREDACCILNDVVSNIVSGETGINALHKDGRRNSQEMYCLAAVLKLMSSSLLKILLILRQNGFLNGMKTVNDCILCRDYEFILRIIGYFVQFSANKLAQNVLNVTRRHTAGLKEIKLMLAHFMSLLQYSFDRGLVFLSKGCIFVMMAVMNLLVFEEGSLDEFRSLVSHKEESSRFNFFLSNNSQKSVLRGLSYRRSSIRIAVNLQTIQNLYLRKSVRFLTYDVKGTDAGPSSINETHNDQSGSFLSIVPMKDVEERGLCAEESDACDGQSFLRYFMEGSDPSDWDDLVGFIEGKHRKDYSSWLKNRGRYNKWRHKKVSVIRYRKRKKRSWKTLMKARKKAD